MHETELNESITQEALPTSLEAAHEELSALKARLDQAERANRELSKLVEESEAAAVRYAEEMKGANDLLRADIERREKLERELRETQARYRRIMKEVTDYVYTVRIEQGLPVETQHGMGCEAVTGYTAAEFQEDPFLWYRMIPEEDRPAVQAQISKILEGEEPKPLEHRIRRKDGAIRWIRNTPVLNRDPQGRLRFYDGLIKDITLRHQAEEKLEQSEFKYRELVENSYSLIVRLDEQGRITFFNEYAQRFFGYTEDDLLGLPFFGALFLDAEILGQDQSLLLGNPERFRRFECQARTRDRTEVWVSWNVKPLHSDLGRFSGLLAVGIDITERKRLEEQLRQLSRRDGLTGIPNRRVFDETLCHEYPRAFRNRTALSLILIDIDHFKAFNDSCGHQAGDDCLRRVAEALDRALKRPSDLAARYGGEEFGIILPDTDAEGAYQVAEALRHEVIALAIPHPRSPVAPNVTISLGLATTVLGEFDGPERLLVQADHELYRAKESGRNQTRGAERGQK